MKRLIVAITGASGAVYGVRLLQLLRAVPQVETHLVLSQAGGLTVAQELDMTRTDLEALADVVDARLSAAWAGGGGVVAVVAVAAVRAEPHGADGGAIVAHLDGPHRNR